MWYADVDHCRSLEETIFFFELTTRQLNRFELVTTILTVFFYLGTGTLGSETPKINIFTIFNPNLTIFDLTTKILTFEPKF